MIESDVLRDTDGDFSGSSDLGTYHLLLGVRGGTLQKPAVQPTARMKGKPRLSV